MDVRQRLTDGTARVRGGVIASMLLALVVACSQLVNLPRFVGLEDALSLSPSGGEISRLTPITVTFPKAPADRTPDGLLQLLPSTPGSYAWLGPKTLLFQPEFPGLLRGGTYTAVVPANADLGVPKTITKQFTVTGKLTVQQVIPGDGDTEVPLGAQVLVQFSRSVAPLTTLAAQPTDQVVTFDPPLHGTGEWLNTSIYRFIPTDLVPTTTYKILVKKGLTSAADGVLESDFRSSFTTISPAVDSIVPDGAWLYGGPWQEVVVTFNQPMDGSASSGVTVRDSTDGTLVPERATWNADRTVLTLNPTARMQSETKYVITVDKGLGAARGGVLAQPRTSSFTTVGAPRVSQTYPANGQKDAGRYGVSLQFASPMEPDSLEGKIHISGISDKDLEGKVYTYAFGLSASLTLEASHSYTVTFDAGAKDQYGQVMGAYTFSFTTGSLPSTVAFALPGYQGATYSSSTEPVLWYWTTNKSEVRFTLYPLTNSEATSWLHCCVTDARWQPSLPAIRTWTERLPDAKDQALLRRTSISGGGPLPKGFYFLQTDGQYMSRFAFAVVDTVLVSKMSLDELLVWVLDHDSGRPISGITVHTGSGEAITNAQGLATFPLPTPMPGTGIDRSTWLWTDEGRFGVLSTHWQSLSPYQFGLPGEYGSRQYVGHVYTDRPIYRPGETVFYKGIVRADDDAQYSLPPRDGFSYVIRNARGQEIKRETVTLDDFGSFNAFFDLPEDAPTGAYYLTITYPANSGRGGINEYAFASNSFTVAAFRKPEFQVEIDTDRASYLSGETIRASATATFFFGGALEGANMQWSAVAEPSYIRAKGFESYSFSDYDYSRQAVARDPIRAKGAGVTGGGGVAAFTIPASLNAAEGAQRFTVSATVLDQNGQAVGGSTSVIVHPASVYVGIRPDRYLATQDVASTMRLVTVDTEGKAIGGQTVRVQVYDRQWITTKVQIPGGGRRYQSDVKDILLTTLTARTAADGTASVRYAPEKPGQLRFVAEVTDAAGRSARSSTQVWAGGHGFGLWQVTNDDAIKLVADKDRYEVGDTAEVLVPAPFAGATALITIERGKIITREVRTFATNSERLRIPIVDRSVPDIFVSVVLYRGPTDVDPLPRYKVGYVELPVSTASRVLNVKITPDRDQAEPRQVVKYALKVTDQNGKGVRAQLSVAVVDKAVLSLMEDRGPDGMKAFWFERGLAVTTNSSMANSLDRWNDVVAELPKIGKGGSGAGGGLNQQPRSDFVNVAYWDAGLVTNDDGSATVEVPMPDDLTTWHMRVRAISGDTLVGEGENELVSTKPLLVRSALPRFVRVGDSVDLRVLVRNATKSERTVGVTLKASGITVKDAARKIAQVAPNASVAYAWPASVSSEGTVSVRFDADDGADLSDAIALEFPAFADLVPETMSTGGIVTKDAALEAIYLPKFADTAHGSLGISVRSALVGSLASELRWFDPCGTCGEEDTMSIASRVIGTIGVARMEKTTRYDARITTDIATIMGRQRPDGGFAWCTKPECTSDPNVTGWVLFALGEARRDARNVDSGVGSRATNFIATYINRPNTTAQATDPHHDQDALLLAALASAGSPTAGTMALAQFEQHRALLANWGRAYLANALLDGGSKPVDAPVRGLLNDLTASTIPSANGNHWEDETTSSKYSFMTSTATTALVALSIARAMPDHQLLPQSIRWLVVARDAQRWQTSIDRAMSILALATYVGVTGELGAEFAYNVSLDQKELMSGQVKASTAPTEESKRVPLANVVTAGKTSLLGVGREFTKSGRLYYTLDLRYMTPATQIDATNRGFAVSHQYTLLGAPGTPVSRARLGDVIRVTLTVIAPHDRNYVTVEDMLPAGLEAIDPQLKTTDPALRAQLEKDRLASYTRSGDKFVAPWYRWYYSPWQQVDTRDDRTILKVDRLTKGMYEYTYYARATTTGDFFVAPAHAEEQFFPEVFGHSDSARFVITAP